MSTPVAPTEKATPRYIEIGINLTDPIYTGHYHGTQRHPSDLPSVITRAVSAGCQKLLVTGSDLSESLAAQDLARAYPGIVYGTVGVHPCSCRKITTDDTHKTAEAYLAALKTLALEGGEGIAAFGEIGLDYDRLELCPRDVQLEFFERQLGIAVDVQLPLFLHSRAAHEDFTRLLRARLDGLPRRGVVHSFTGTAAEMWELVEMGFDIGINGCSLKTEENVAVVRQVPLERLQLETDGPWCEMRPSHASAAFVKGWTDPWKSVKKEKWVEGVMVKGRNEPCTIGKVAMAVAGIKGVDVETVTEAAWKNSVKMFGLGLK